MKDTFKGKIQANKPIPSLDFKKFQSVILQAVEDVNKLSNSSFMMRMRKTIMSVDTDNKGNHVDASIIGNQIDNSEISALVSKITSDPVSTVARVKLVRSVMHDKREFPLSLYRNLLIQAALTIYLGNITPATLQIT